MALPAADLAKVHIPEDITVRQCLVASPVICNALQDVAINLSAAHKVTGSDIVLRSLAVLQHMARLQSPLTTDPAYDAPAFPGLKSADVIISQITSTALHQAV